MRRFDNRFFLYSGLAVLFISFIVRAVDASYNLFWPLFAIAILLKSIFLINIFRSRSFRPSLWLYLILIGVALIFISMFFKTIVPVDWLQNTLFYGAILFKLSGLLLMIYNKGK